MGDLEDENRRSSGVGELILVMKGKKMKRQGNKCNILGVLGHGKVRFRNCTFAPTKVDKLKLLL
jgi:hypothetical protein